MDREAGVEIVGMERDDRQALDKIRRLRPDVIVMDSGASPEDCSLTVSGIFQEIPHARVIALSLRENGIDVYDKQRIVAAGPEDLLRVLRGEAGDGEQSKGPGAGDWGMAGQGDGEDPGPVAQNSEPARKSALRTQHLDEGGGER